MVRRQGFRTKLKSRQHGAVAIIVALSLVVLIGMLGLVLDLGHLYVTKTELQNAADAAALSGAKELNGRVTGITNAINRAVETAGKNKYNLQSQALVISSANIRVGACPSTSCMVPITSITTDALAADKTFLEVNTGSHGLGTWFAQVLSSAASNLATSAVAVAGKYAVDITPIAICQLPDPGTTHELGYERGVSYKVSEANPVGPGTLYWIEPETSTPGNCPTTNTNAGRPYVCAGKTGFTPIVGDTVNTNSGTSLGPFFEALDSRFDLYPPAAQCDPATAPPDTNIKEYVPGSATGSPSQWMGTDPVQQSITFVDRVDNSPCLPNNPCKPQPYSLRTATDYGVLWSGYRPTGATVAQWSALYSGNTATSYPETSPYAQSSGDFFQAPSVAHQPGKPGRRVLNMVIVDCSAAGGNCRPVTVLGVGKFLMQRKASKPNSDKDLYVEFGGLLPTPLPNSEIKLYR